MGEPIYRINTTQGYVQYNAETLEASQEKLIVPSKMSKIHESVNSKAYLLGRSLFPATKDEEVGHMATAVTAFANALGQAIFDDGNALTLTSKMLKKVASKFVEGLYDGCDAIV